jgi:hypothetical protein
MLLGLTPADACSTHWNWRTRVRFLTDATLHDVTTLAGFPVDGDKNRLSQYGVGTATQRPRKRPPTESELVVFVCELVSAPGGSRGAGFAAGVTGANFFQVKSRAFAESSKAGLEFWSPAIPGNILGAVPQVNATETTHMCTAEDAVGGFTLGVSTRARVCVCVCAWCV